MAEPAGPTVIEPDGLAVAEPAGRTVAEADGRTVIEPAGLTVMADGARLRIDATFRHEAGRLVGALTRYLGDFDLAEEAVQDALAEAVARWPAEGVPEPPAAWLQTTARNRAIDRLRREARGARSWP